MFQKLLRKTSSRQFSLLSLFLLLIFLSVGIFLYWQNTKAAEKGEISAAKQKSLLLVRGGASTISEFLLSRKAELLLLAQNPTIANLADKKLAREQLEVLFDSLSEKPLADIIRIDKEGKVILLVGKERVITGEGIDVSSQDFFIWAKKPENRGKVFVAGPIFPQTGNVSQDPAFIKATPTYYNNQFTGVLLFSFLPLQLTEQYILPLRISPKSHTWLITSKGTFIGGEIKDFLGKNLIEAVKEWPEGKNLVAILEKSTKGKEGVEEGFFAIPGENRPNKKIVAFSPVVIEGAKIVVLSIESEETIKSLFPEFFQNQIFLLVLITLFALAVGILGSISIRLAQRDGFLDGIREGYHKAKTEELKKE
ncbi:MAG: cache domain-containing protein [Candidatus Gottesmanbacteria bacterium]